MTARTMTASCQVILGETNMTRWTCCRHVDALCSPVSGECRWFIVAPKPRVQPTKS